MSHNTCIGLPPSGLTAYTPLEVMPLWWSWEQLFGTKGNEIFSFVMITLFRSGQEEEKFVCRGLKDWQLNYNFPLPSKHLSLKLAFIWLGSLPRLEPIRPFSRKALHLCWFKFFFNRFWLLLSQIWWCSACFFKMTAVQESHNFTLYEVIVSVVLPCAPQKEYFWRSFFPPNSTFLLTHILNTLEN